MQDKNQLKYLELKLGDVLLEIDTKRLASVHKMKVFGSKNTFYIKYLDNADEQIVSHRHHDRYQKTGHNINEDSDSD